MKGLYYLTAAYSIIWIGLYLYLVGLGRRATRLEQEIELLGEESRRR
jgi:CcmD family protein